jgi:hypothetical protein
MVIGLSPNGEIPTIREPLSGSSMEPWAPSGTGPRVGAGPWGAAGLKIPSDEMESGLPTRGFGTPLPSPPSTDVGGGGFFLPRRFTTWSLFLISNPAWLHADSSEKIAALFKTYDAFGQAIGRDHAAVWFGKLPAPLQDTRKFDFAAHLDTDRCATYSSKFRLEIAKSPHVVVTTWHPALEAELGDYLVLELNGLSPQSTIHLLTELTNQILNAKLDQIELSSKRWWLAWRDVPRSVLESLSSPWQGVTVRLKTPFLDVTTGPVKATAAKKRPSKANKHR